MMRKMPLVKRRLPNISPEEEQKTSRYVAFIKEKHVDIDPVTGEKNSSNEVIKDLGWTSYNLYHAS